MLDCPSDLTLARLGHDTLDVAQRTAIEEHVQHCEKCVGVLEQFVSHDTATAPDSASLPAEEDLPQIPGFAIEGEIGRGGMGVVYRAWEPKLARLVALKIVRSGPMTGSRERKRWLSEARYGTRVCHPNIVRIHDADETDGWLYLVLEFVPGGSLKERLGGPLPARAAAELMVPVAAAMSAVHAAGLLHLDLKPSNILLDSPVNAAWKDACPKVADFGLARPLADPGTSSTSMAGPWGTPSYMAPEQVEAVRALGPATDVYALGAILYELLTGRPPFQGASTLETVDQVRGQQPVPPRRLNPKIPRDLETITLKCLEKIPSQRYSSAEAMADDLRRCLDGRPIQARPVSPVEHGWRWCRRRPAVAVLAATLALTSVGGFLGLLALVRHSETLRSRSEANYQVASQSLEHLMSMFQHLMYDKTVNKDDHDRKDQLWNAMESARSQELERSKRYPLDIRALRRLAQIDDCCAHFCLGNGKPDEARSLTEESIRSLESCLALSPDDLDIHRMLLGQIARMLYIIEPSDGYLYERWNTRSIATLRRLEYSQEHSYREVCLLSRCHRLHADALMRHGEAVRARKVLEEDLDLLRSVSQSEVAFPEIAFNEALTLGRLGKWNGKLTLLRTPSHFQSAKIDTNVLEPGLAELTARRIGWILSNDSPDWLIPEDLPAEPWSDRVISSIQSDAATLDCNHTRIPAVCWQMRNHCANALERLKMLGNHDDERRLFDRLLTLARRLTQLYPDQAEAYMLLSEGYIERAIITDHVDGEAVIGWEQEALAAALHAATLDPKHDEAHRLVKDRRTRVRIVQVVHRFIFQAHDHLTAEDWADRVASFLSPISTTDSMRHLKESEVGYLLIFESLDPKAAAERHAAKLDDARRTVDRIYALAKLLVARYPDQAAAHLCLSEALSQRAKNAWRTDDRVAIERNLIQALDESRQALRLDPQNARAENLVIEYQRRLNNLLTPHKEAVAQGPSVRAL
jgi:serine/threonine protein kinase